ncbi:hypothetical protein CG709_08700 [Lachnotalea glycerini]|nr:hypothetical protein CG709_08700 [Lachnotalea glycerini]
MSDVDSIYYEKNYYVVPEKGAEKAFELLRQAMMFQEEIAIAKTVIGTKEQLLVLYPNKNTIIAKTLFYQEELQEIPNTQLNIQINEPELEMAKTLISTMTEKFDIAKYRDEYQQRLKEAIETKIKGQNIVSVDTSAPSNVIDLMEALKKTVEMTKKGTA